MGDLWMCHGWQVPTKSQPSYDQVTAKLWPSQAKLGQSYEQFTTMSWSKSKWIHFIVYYLPAGLLGPKKDYTISRSL
jgi:hypothetical protein